MSQPPTRTISHYRVLEKIGSGGMGDVFKAEDLALGRTIALKFLNEQSAGERQAVERFRREARAISTLNHANICTIYEIGEADGQYFIAMEFLSGKTLREHISGKALDSGELLDLGMQIADALDSAHSQGVIHRDIKPENIFLTPRGQIKILDFGLAKVDDSIQETAAPGQTAVDYHSLTSRGATVGTVAYMSPEQTRGEAIDSRTDIFSFGTVLYEMACGRRPFTGETSAAVSDAILHAAPAALASVNPSVSTALDRIIFKALEKNRERRFASAAELRAELEALRQRRLIESSGNQPIVQVMRKPSFIAGAVLFLALGIIAAGLVYRHYARVSWLHEKAMAEVLQLMMDGKGIPAYRLIKQAEGFAPHDPALAKLKAATLWPNGIISTPPGADVQVRDYKDIDGPWEYLGKTPLQGNKLPHAFYAFKLTKKGYEPVEATGTAFEKSPVDAILDPVGTLPAGMVRIPAGEEDPTGHASEQVDGFLMDKFELSNRAYKQFVEAGGYRDAKYWKIPFAKDGQTLSFEQAMLLFRDKTDRAGPSTWELATYPAGEDDYPVSGVSWYEATAYAQFAGKSLPTVFHWYRAADMGRFSDILPASNFAGKGPAKSGSYPSLGPFGTYDMAGNVKEWCYNSSGDRKYLLGGASTDPPYMYQEPDARSPFDRAATNGIRLVKYLRSEPLAEALTAPVSFAKADYREVKPVSDATFSIYKSLYSYDHTPLEARVESEDDSSPYWRRERITFNAAYGNERVIAYLYLPKNSSPPYQTVVYFPHSGAQAFHTVEDTQLSLIDFVVKSGRALMFPIYKDTYERLGDPPDSGTIAERDETIQQAKDLRRSIDYLETRSDIDSKRLAYYGISWGAVLGPVMIGVENRLKAAIFAAGGCERERVLPEIDPMNFASRVKIPVLMINGRYDFVVPLETCQEPFFQQLGAAPADKKHILFDTGHTPPILPVMKESLNWLDHYLGPVK
jgi:eukaryotic-like serine/threonine-protein kinase